MKKLLIAIIAAALVLVIGVTGVFAASSEKGRNYTDTDNDGVCDVCLADGGVCPNGGVRSLDGSGRQNGRGAANRGAGFVDADGDGICDACPNGGVRPLDGSGKQNGRGAANRGAGFVDADGNGICDTCPNGGVRPLDGSGRQNGGRRAGMRNK